MMATSASSAIGILPASERADDGLLRDAVLQGLRHSGYRSLFNVQCDVTDGAVALAGVVPSFFMKQIAQTIILRLGGVNRLANNLEVRSAFRDADPSESHREFEKLAS
jgi:osmotically-inducible protein OsmY